MSIFKRSKKTEKAEVGTSRGTKIKEAEARSPVPSKIKKEIIRPRLSEKATEQSKDGKYTFIVREGAPQTALHQN